jgi:hypothetical protein
MNRRLVQALDQASSLLAVRYTQAGPSGAAVGQQQGHVWCQLPSHSLYDVGLHLLGQADARLQQLHALLEVQCLLRLPAGAACTSTGAQQLLLTVSRKEQTPWQRQRLGCGCTPGLPVLPNLWRMVNSTQGLLPSITPVVCFTCNHLRATA